MRDNDVVWLRAFRESVEKMFPTISRYATGDADLAVEALRSNSGPVEGCPYQSIVRQLEQVLRPILPVLEPYLTKDGYETIRRSFLMALIPFDCTCAEG